MRELTAEEELICMKYFMSHRIDYDGFRTVLTAYETYRSDIVRQCAYENLIPGGDLNGA